jgi:DNA-binding MarR family transcriptional regulator
MNDDLVNQFIWTAASINVHIEQIFEAYGKLLNLSRPQSMILSILNDKGAGRRMAVKDVSAIMHVDGSFVTMQSKKLEQLGLVQRAVAEHDARVVHLSLSAEGERQVASLHAHRELVRTVAFDEFGELDFQNLHAQLSSLEKRLEKASVLVELN